MARSRILLLVTLPALLAYLITAALAGDWLAWPRLAGILYVATQDAYPLSYQAGPPHRVLVDYLIVSPVVVILGLALAAQLAVWPRLPWTPDSRRIAWLLLAVLGVFGFASSKNLRYAIVADPLFRLLAAVWLGGRTEGWLLWVIVAGSGLTELALFWVIFYSGGVYDPTSLALARALRMIP